MNESSEFESKPGETANDSVRANRGGTLVGERYRLETSIGSGGMGCVWVGTDTFTGGTVAVKTLRPDLSRDGLVISRLQREASIGSRVKSRHVVRTLDHGDDDHLGPFIVFEYLRGETLADVLDRRHAIGTLEAAAIIIDVLEGLSTFHAAGLVHRDVKPDNVFLVRERDADGSLRHIARLIDFGLSRAMTATDDGTARVTMEGIVAGTPEYMAPEQIADASDQDQHVDLYAAGVMLYQLLSGELPYRGSKPEAIFEAVLKGAAPRLLDIAPTVDSQLARIVHRAMARDASKRFRDAADMLDALRRWAEDHRARMPTATSAEATQKLPAIPVPRRVHRSRPNRRHRTVIGSVASAAALAAIAFFAWPRRHAAPTVELTSPTSDTRASVAITSPTGLENMPRHAARRAAASQQTFGQPSNNLHVDATAAHRAVATRTNARGTGADTDSLSEPMAAQLALAIASLRASGAIADDTAADAGVAAPVNEVDTRAAAPDAPLDLPANPY